jgi:hypothetical protein
MRRIGLAVVLAVGLVLAAFAAEGQTGERCSHRLSRDRPGRCLQHNRGLPSRTV